MLVKCLDLLGLVVLLWGWCGFSSPSIGGLSSGSDQSGRKTSAVSCLFVWCFYLYEISRKVVMLRFVKQPKGLLSYESIRLKLCVCFHGGLEVEHLCKVLLSISLNAHHFSPGKWVKEKLYSR